MVLKNFFVMYNLEADLRTRFRDQKFCDAIRHPFVRVKQDPNAIEDTLDGTVYPQNTQYGQLHTLGSSDGIRVFKTTVEELWLVMLEIFELPPEVRSKQENMLILGAWWGAKPNFNCFLLPISEQLNALKDHGFMAENHLNQPVYVTLRLLVTTADNPAKEALENYKSTACGVCHQVGESTLPFEKKKKKLKKKIIKKKIIKKKKEKKR